MHRCPDMPAKELMMSKVLERLGEKTPKSDKKVVGKEGPASTRKDKTPMKQKETPKKVTAGSGKKKRKSLPA